MGESKTNVNTVYHINQVDTNIFISFLFHTSNLSLKKLMGVLKHNQTKLFNIFIFKNNFIVKHLFEKPQTVLNLMDFVFSKKISNIKLTSNFFKKNFLKFLKKKFKRVDNFP